MPGGRASVGHLRSTGPFIEHVECAASGLMGYGTVMCPFSQDLMAQQEVIIMEVTGSVENIVTRSTRVSTLLSLTTHASN